MNAIDWGAEGDGCVALLQELIRIPTVNRGADGPSDGHERPAAERVASLLREHRLEPTLLEPSPGRTSLVTRFRGTGDKPPLLLTAHLDVVDAEPSRWQYDPFAGEIHDGYVWGRGAVDMKHMVAMSTWVMTLLARGAHERKLTRDVIFAAVADEEAGSAKGSFFLVDEHPDLVRAEYALGEVGAFSLPMFGKIFYPVQIAEKGVCWVRATFKGEPGHGSMPDPNSAVLKLARAVSRLGSKSLPVHPTAALEAALGAMAAHMPQPQRAVMKRLTTPQLSRIILDYLVRDPDQRRSFSALVSNTATPTVLRAGSRPNVIPGSAQVDIDGRTLPGQTTEMFLAELRHALGPEAEDADLTVLNERPPLVTPQDTDLYGHLAATIRRHDPLGIPVPYLMPGFTDAKAFSKLGTHCYGFAPIRFDPEAHVRFARMYHGDDERAPVDGLKWGLHTLFDAVVDFCST